MKLSGVGLEPHECNDEFLSKRLGLSKAGLILEGIVFGLIVLFGSVFLFFYHENALPVLAMIAVFGLIFGIPGFFTFREVRAIQEELDKRARETGDNSYIDETRKASRCTLIIIVIGIAIFTAILTSVLLGGIGSSGSLDGDGKTTCKNCGSRKSLSPITGYCSRCDESFWDWQSKQ